MANWIEIRISIPQAEDHGPQLFDFGIQGVEVLTDDRLRCFMQEDATNFAQLENFINQINGKIVSCNSVNAEGWVECCQELQEPIQIGRLSFVPDHISADIEDAIKIRYGSGFGTGHHTATQLVIELLQDQRLQLPGNGVALDLGCGSGILALAIAKHFKIKVLAIDNDPLALENARDNIELNKFSSLISAVTTDLGQLSDKYCLVVANIYAEVLCELSDLILARLESDALLIMSGIKDELCREVELKFSALEMIDRKSRDGWSALLMRKI